MKLKRKIEVLAKKSISFATKDLEDKIKIELLVNGKKIDGAFMMKGEKSNTTEIELKEAMLLNYCYEQDIYVLG